MTCDSASGSRMPTYRSCRMLSWSNSPRRCLQPGLGSRVSRYLPGKVMEESLGIIFGLVGLLLMTLELIA